MSSKEILIIDDDKDLTRALQVTLESRNYVVDTANDAETGIQKFKASRPDLLILDVMMASDLEGHQIAHTIKNDPENKDLPILIITGMLDAMGVNIREAFEGIEDLPFVFMLDKPFEMEEFLSKVDHLIAGTLDD
jgi:two-component system alkaline phosphatase synthesis response regulator PhoP